MDVNDIKEKKKSLMMKRFASEINGQTGGRFTRRFFSDRRAAHIEIT